MARSGSRSPACSSQSRKRSGTVVAQPRAESAVLAINNIGEEVAALGRRYKWSLLSSERRSGNAQDRRILNLQEDDADTDCLFLQGLHYSNDEPFCLETRVINIATAPDAARVDFEKEVPGAWLLNTMPWTKARHHVRAINVSGRDAMLLELPVGAACLEVQRRTQIDENWVTCARLLYPGEAHQLIAEFDSKVGH